ncbi:Proteasome subunit alpha, bacterial [Euzebya pacifica]|uniref:Proteasome subunit alpha, bacterial n=1 Tax=Euzebya pacifica TaxID=1608957 RepID=A0A346XYF7_9ACTN|nr:proteasome subunit alpha [Euzebya pacifica]AXV07254.1 Proteasome subunit alpha, bacterial [Euzebya pacifica]
MPMMPYVSPEQAMKDKADFARKGISRGRSVVALTTENGLLFVAENPSATLHKVSEIYDCIAFAAVGKYNEFEQLRVAGIRLADVKGYQYSRDDVTGRALANAYANAMGATFTDSPKPLEVELLVAEVAEDDVELYHILYDGSITDEENYVAIGGSAEAINEALKNRFEPGMDRATALRTTVAALQEVEEREMVADRLEVAGLDRALGRRKFFRLSEDDIAGMLS